MWLALGATFLLIVLGLVVVKARRTRTLKADYISKLYWNHRYNLRTTAFEWYNTSFDVTLATLGTSKHWQHLFPLSPGSKGTSIPVRDVLNIGCGNSLFSERMKDHYGSAVLMYNIDYSDQAIRLMKPCETPGNTYEVMDARHMIYTDCSFDLALEKGTLDGILQEVSSESVSVASSVLGEIGRVLRNDGVFVSISINSPALYDEHISPILPSNLRQVDQFEVVRPSPASEEQMINVYVYLFKKN